MVRRKAGPGQTDYVEHGSDQHAALLGLQKAKESDKTQYEGWILADAAEYIRMDPTGRLEEYTLQQKVNELTTPLPEVQSESPQKPHYAPLRWDPDSKDPRAQSVGA